MLETTDELLEHREALYEEQRDLLCEVGVNGSRLDRALLQEEIAAIDAELADRATPPLEGGV
jgi:hypothetical protein